VLCFIDRLAASELNTAWMIRVVDFPVVVLVGQFNVNIFTASAKFKSEF